MPRPASHRKRLISLALTLMALSGCDRLRVWWQSHLAAYQAEAAEPLRAQIQEGRGNSSHDLEYELLYLPPSKTYQHYTFPEALKDSGLFLQDGNLRFCHTQMKLCLQLTGVPSWTKTSSFDFQLAMAKLKVEGYNFKPGPRINVKYYNQEQTHMISTSRDGFDWVQRVDFWQIPTLAIPHRTIMTLRNGSQYNSRVREWETLSPDAFPSDPWTTTGVRNVDLPLDPIPNPVRKEGQKMTLTKRSRSEDLRAELYEAGPFYIVVIDVDPRAAHSALTLGFTQSSGKVSSVFLPGPMLGTLIATDGRTGKVLIGNIGLTQTLRLAQKYFGD